MLITCNRNRDVFPKIVHKVVCIPRDAKASFVYPGCSRYGTKVVESFWAEDFEGFKEVFASHKLAGIKFQDQPEDAKHFCFNGDIFDLSYIMTGKAYWNVEGRLKGYDSGLLAHFIEQLSPFVPEEGDLVLEDYWTLDLQGVLGSFLETCIKSFNHDFSLLDPKVPETVSLGQRIVFTKGVEQEVNA